MKDINYFETDEYADVWYEQLQAQEVSRLIAAPQQTTVQQVIDEERENYIKSVFVRKRDLMPLIIKKG